jgi:type I restriction enzyme, S subunit
LDLKSKQVQEFQETEMWKWGDIATLEYGKGIRDYRKKSGKYQVFGTNGPIGWHDEYLCNHESVIVGRKGAYRGIHFSEKPFHVIDTAFFLKPKTKFDMKWAYYELLTHDINTMDSGSAIPSTTRDDFYLLDVVIHPLDIQIKIGSFFWKIDKKIENLQNQNHILEQTAQAIFKSWFVDFDGVTEWDDSELGKIPKGWGVEALDENINFLNGIALQKFRPKNNEFLPVIKIKEMKEGFSDKTEKAGLHINPKYIVKNGDVLFSWSGSLELTVWHREDGALNQHIFKVTSEKYKNWFYYQWIKYHLLEFKRIAEGKVTTMGHIQRHHLSEAKILVPLPKTLEKYNSLFQPVFDQILSNRLKSELLTKTRDALLPKLMSGEIRV